MRASFLKGGFIAVVFLAGVARAQVETRAPRGIADLSHQITPGAGLTSDGAARQAVATSHDVEAGARQVDAAEATVSTAEAGYVPKLTSFARYTRLSDIGPQLIGHVAAPAPETPEGPIAAGTTLFNVPIAVVSQTDNTTLGAQLAVPVSDYFLRVPQAVSSAKSARDSSRDSLVATRHDVDLSARSAYFIWVRARLTTYVAELAVQTAQDHLGDVQKAARLGSASKADVLRVESSVAQADLTLVRARNGAELSEVRLRTLLHDASRGPLAIGEDVLAELPVADEDLDDLTRRALDRRPELGALDHGAKATRSRADVQRAAYLPRLDLVADVTYANPNPRFFPSTADFHETWDVGAQVTWTPTDAFATHGQVRETEAQARRIEAQRAAAEDAIRVEVVSAWQAVKEARQAIATTTSALGTAEEAYRVQRALFQNGRATSLELTDAELDLTRARLDAIDARIDLRAAKASVAKAVGE